MLTYLQSLLPRLKQYSKTLDDIASFADIPWAFIDDNGVKITYIFRRQGDILVSRQGEVTRGTWEYIPQLQSLLIQAQGRERIYNQGILLDKAVMVLRKDGTEELFALANPERIPDLNIVRFLERYEPQRIQTWINNTENVVLKPVNRTLRDGTKIQLKPYYGGNLFYYTGCLATFSVTENPLPDGIYRIQEDTALKLHVKKGMVELVEGG